MSYLVYPKEFIDGVIAGSEHYATERKIGKCGHISPDGRYTCNANHRTSGLHYFSIIWPNYQGRAIEVAEWMNEDCGTAPLPASPMIAGDFRVGKITALANGKHLISGPRAGKYEFTFYKPSIIGMLMASAKADCQEHYDSPEKRKLLAWINKRHHVQKCENPDCALDGPCAECYRCNGCNGWAKKSEYTRCSACHGARSRSLTAIAHSGCCQCFVCPSCGDNRSRADAHLSVGGCGNCNGCCRCGREIPMRSPTMDFNGKPTTRYPRFLGIEIECGIPNVSPVQKTRFDVLKTFLTKYGTGVTHDGSIMINGHHGGEFITSPARGDHFVAQITELTAILHGYRATVNKTCGLHVHVDCRRMSSENKLTIIRAYSRVEKALYSIVSFSRRGEKPAVLNKYTAQGGYTNPWADKFKVNGVLDDTLTVEQRIEKLDLAVYGTAPLAAVYKASHQKHGSRYHGLNVQSLHVHNTMEFRLHQGTVNCNKILMWAGIISAVVQYALEHTEDKIKALTGTSAEILETMMGEDQELIQWSRARRAFFILQERRRRSLKLSKLNNHVAQMTVAEESEEPGPERQRSSFIREQRRLESLAALQEAARTINNERLNDWDLLQTPLAQLAGSSVYRRPSR